MSVGCVSESLGSSFSTLGSLVFNCLGSWATLNMVLVQTEALEPAHSRPARPRVISRTPAGSHFPRTSTTNHSTNHYLLQELLATRAEATAVLDPVLFSPGAFCCRGLGELALSSSRFYRLLSLWLFWLGQSNSARIQQMTPLRSLVLTATCRKDYAAQFGACVILPTELTCICMASTAPGNCARITS